ncbi:MAG: beta-ketoacyl-[acyl-carrier-protein] synthase family protein [Deltaproteobacteria bacterium]|nr:beta-ketoacyl-[acyl-carrier-protein] synthase family protein [Deltaproteobacteria bacterium]MBW2536579.1 beta-ketoacyl-[acyl-carrier-protein] synthase family protein [Deltaproteobacteria bacterium]
MGVNTALGDDLDTYYENLIAGKSALTHWKCVDADGIYSKVGGDISDYDTKGKAASFEGKLPAASFKRMRRLVKKAPFSTSLSMLTAASAWTDAGLVDKIDPERWAVIVGGHNLNKHYQHLNQVQFEEEPDYIDSLAALLALDTDHAGSVGEVLGCQGTIYTMGGACASGNVALRNAVDEIRYHDYDVVLVVGAALEYAPMDLHAMALMGAISFQSFNDEPHRASRPYDTAREGFVPSHGTGALVVESLEHAKARGATIYAEVLHVTAMSDACHLPQPSQDGQARTMQRLFKNSGVEPEEVDYVCAHATSTPLGDLTEIKSIKSVFGDHAKKIKVNAPKSMLGHTCWSAPTVETIGAILQMQRGKLHPSINIDNLDPEVDLDVCANQAVDYEVRTFVKNAFGFGGINCCALFRRYDD